MQPTAIVVPFHDMPAVVAAHRRALTTDGADGMPPHVTLLYPFADDADLTEGEIERLRRALGPFAPFDVALTRFARFHAQPPVHDAALDVVEVEVGRHLPIHARVAEVAVMEYGGDAWRPRERIALNAE